MYHKYKLKNSSDDVVKYSMNDVTCYAKLVNVYDGDTFRACVYHNGRIKKLTFRPVGYDAPEMKPSKSMENRDEYIIKAKEAREYFISACGGIGSFIFVHCHEYDKYGRVLVTVYKKREDNNTINSIMLDSGLVNAYDGKTKKSFVINV